MIDLNEVLQEEKKLRFSEFSNQIALEFAAEVERIINAESDKPVAVRVTLDEQTILDYRTNKRQGSGWLTRKVKTVIKAQHSSMFVFLNQTKDPFQNWIGDESYAVCGGGFPLYINDQLRGVLAVSGLNHQDDHRVLVTALNKIIK